MFSWWYICLSNNVISSVSHYSPSKHRLKSFLRIILMAIFFDQGTPHHKKAIISFAHIIWEIRHNNMLKGQIDIAQFKCHFNRIARLFYFCPWNMKPPISGFGCGYFAKHSDDFMVFCIFLGASPIWALRATSSWEISPKSALAISHDIPRDESQRKAVEKW